MEIDEAAEMTGPTIASGIIAHLRLYEAGNHRHYAVDVSLLEDAGLVHQLVGASQHLLGEQVGVGRGRESRYVTLEKQFAPRCVPHCERNELGHELLQSAPCVTGE